MEGSRASWRDILAVYAVKATTYEENGQEVVTVTDEKKDIIREVFWDMNELSARTVVEYEPHTVMVDDGEGNLVESTETVAIVYLYITVKHKTAEDIQVEYSFDKNQRQQLSELLSPEYECYLLFLEKHILPHFEPKKYTLSGITAQDLQEYYNTKLDEGLSVCTMKKHSAILHGALAEAYKKDMIAANPADKVTLPRKKKFYGQSYSVEEVQQLLSVLNDDPIRPAVILAVMYGLRRSEAVGLRWKDIDFKNKTMTICNTVTRMATVHELEETKNESSHRTLPLIPGTEEYLQSLRREQKETMLLCGNRFDDSCHVCTWPDGRSLQPDYVSQHFKQVLKKNNFRVIRYHDLRHTAGSMLLQKGIDIKTIQHFLGHSQASTTVNIYLHSISNGTVDAANAIGSMVNVGTAC